MTHCRFGLVYLYLVVLGLALFTPLIGLAQAYEYVSMVNLPYVDGNQSTEDYVNGLYILAISVAAFLAVIKIIFAGVKYVMSDIVTSKEDAKTDIRGALIGLMIVLGAWIILNTINPSLTELNALKNAPPLRQAEQGTGQNPACHTNDDRSQTICLNQGEEIIFFACDGNDCTQAEVDCVMRDRDNEHITLIDHLGLSFKADHVTCIYSLTTVTPPTNETQLSHADALQALGSAGIEVTSTSGPGGVNETCATGDGCTSLHNIREDTITQTIALCSKVGSGNCVVTGGTEPGHVGGQYSHSEGYKIDLDDTEALDNYIMNNDNFRHTTDRPGPNGGPVYQDSCNNAYVRESNPSHWDITVFTVCDLP